MNANSFYSKCFNNIYSNKVFFKYYNNIKRYSELKFFYNKFLNLIKNKERLKIITFSDKSFEMYAATASIFLSNNIWIPLSNNLPLNRIIKIFELSKPDILIVSKNSLLLKNKLLLSSIKNLKIKIISYNEINNVKENKKNFPKKKD